MEPLDTTTGEGELAAGGEEEGFPFSFQVLGNIINNVKNPLASCMQSRSGRTQMAGEQSFHLLLSSRKPSCFPLVVKQ